MFALVDCNNFYASCERLFRPDLRGLPIVVLSNNDGCVIARSNEAKALGIGMGEPYFKIRHLVEEHGLEVFSSNYALYGDISNRVMTTLRELAPEVEIYSIDEAFLNLTGMPEPLSAVGRRIKGEVWRLVGIPVGVGIAPTKTLAKLANWCAKKHTRGGVAFLATEAQREKVLRFAPVDEVWGIGRRLTKSLADMGVHTAWDLAQCSPDEIRKHYSVTVAKVVRELRGERCIDLEESPEPKKTIACSRSFSERVTDLESLKEAVATYTSRAAEKLRAQGDGCQVITVYIRTGVFNEREPHYSRHATLRLSHPTQDSRTLVKAAVAGLERIYADGYRYLKAGIELTDLAPLHREQMDLFTGDTERSKAIMSVMDKINRRMGRSQVRLAAVPADPAWRMRQSQKSPNYVTSWCDLRLVT